MIGWFDLVALQEIKENFGPLFDVMDLLGKRFRVVFSDVAGNNERMAFVYNADRVSLLEEVGELAFPVRDLEHVAIEGIRQRFEGFDRPPYIATFRCGRICLTFINVHLYFGSAGKSGMDRRSLETYAVARYAALRRKAKFGFTRELVALGDFNMPKAGRQRSDLQGADEPGAQGTGA